MATKNKETEIGNISIITMGHHGNNVKCFRGLRNMKQPELAEKIGVSVPTMHNIENRAIIDDETLEKIAKALNVSIEDVKYYNSNCDITITNFHDTSKKYESNATDSSNTNIGVPVNEYSSVYERLIEKEREIAAKDIEILELKHKLKELENKQ